MHTKYEKAWDFYRNERFLSKFTLKRYDCDPFVPVIELEDGVFCLPHYSPDNIAASNTYLVCGTERAMIIDTAYGIGDMKALCEELTSLPLILVNTHNHYDHTGGNTRFGACFMHELDAQKPAMLNKPPQIAIIEKNPDNFYTIDDVAVPGTGEVTAIKGGHVFDLGGGFEIEAIHLAGHTSGNIALLDKKRGILFTGDALMTQPCSTLIVNFAGTANDEYSTVEAFRDNLIPLAGRTDEIRYLCPGHCAIKADSRIVSDALTCCEEILADPDIGGEARFRSGAKMHACGEMSITYTENHIYRQR